MNLTTYPQVVECHLFRGVETLIATGGSLNANGWDLAAIAPSSIVLNVIVQITSTDVSVARLEESDSVSTSFTAISGSSMTGAELPSATDTAKWLKWWISPKNNLRKRYLRPQITVAAGGGTGIRLVSWAEAYGPGVVPPLTATGIGTDAYKIVQ